jgi:hypothetical protein
MSKRATLVCVFLTSVSRWGISADVAVVRMSSWIAATPPIPVEGSASAAPAAAAMAAPVRARRVLLKGFLTGSFLPRGPKAAAWYQPSAGTPQT